MPFGCINCSSYYRSSYVPNIIIKKILCYNNLELYEKTLIAYEIKSGSW